MSSTYKNKPYNITKTLKNQKQCCTKSQNKLELLVERKKTKNWEFGLRWFT